MEHTMELNKETALRLWSKQFGNKQKAYDFTGRAIAKAAYNDRGSKFGWNVDHILPQSRGGKTADYNLICCHILTNDEKSDRFPCFTANEKVFEIQKKQNHYELVLKSNNYDEDDDKETDYNLLDVADGMKFWKRCKESQVDCFVGFAKIKLTLKDNSNTFIRRFQNFIEEVFSSPAVFATVVNGNIWSIYSGFPRSIVFTVIDYQVSTKEETQNLLDNCILLNTYREFFSAKYECDIQIKCGMKHYDSKLDMQMSVNKDIIEKQDDFISDNPLSIDDLIKINTDANEKNDLYINQYSYYPYNYVFTKLQKDLNKQI